MQFIFMMTKLNFENCRFDVILDCTGRTSGFAYDLLKPWSNAKYVTLSPPTLRNFDEHGMIGGVVKSGIDLLATNSSAILEGKTLRWGYFIPSSSGFTKLVDLFQQKKVNLTQLHGLCACETFCYYFYSYGQLSTVFSLMTSYRMLMQK